VLGVGADNHLSDGHSRSHLYRQQEIWCMFKYIISFLFLTIMPVDCLVLDVVFLGG
jgi:hypothetical protein